MVLTTNKNRNYIFNEISYYVYSALALLYDIDYKHCKLYILFWRW